MLLLLNPVLAITNQKKMNFRFFRNHKLLLLLVLPLDIKFITESEIKAINSNKKSELIIFVAKIVDTRKDRIPSLAQIQQEYPVHTWNTDVCQDDTPHR